MQREIKYRGKDVKSKQWIYGTYYKHEKVTLCPMGLTEKDIKENELHLIINGGFSDWNLPAKLNGYEVIPETVGQFTGLTDKNEKDIYEGDIYHQGDKNILYVVVWHDNGFVGKQIRANSYAGLSYWKDRIEILGNIHDNPELLGIHN